MGLRDRINAARTTRELRGALEDLVDDPNETGIKGRAATHRQLQSDLRQAERRQANARHTH